LSCRMRQEQKPGWPLSSLPQDISNDPASA
jgi:hypothetical protein